MEINLYVSLEDIYLGKTLKFLITKETICNHCRGSGAENPDDVKICDMCDGRGVYFRRINVGGGYI